jgi:hypothetical protein
MCWLCGARLGGDPFQFRDLALCCECMSALCSWLLDGGLVENPELFAPVLNAAELLEGTR